MTQSQGQGHDGNDLGGRAKGGRAGSPRGDAAAPTPPATRKVIHPGSIDAWHAALSREARELRRRGDDEGLRRNRLADALRESAFNRLARDLADHGLGDYADALVTGDYSGMEGAETGVDED